MVLILYPLKFTAWLKYLWLSSLQATENERIAKLITKNLMDFQPFRKYSNTFIETGTNHGVSVYSALEAGFTIIKSVELDPKLYNQCLLKFSGNNKVKLYHGKSVDRLPEMIADIEIPSVFWLDAHPSGPGTAGHEEWLKRDKSVYQDNILAEELGIILEHGRHVILIDDQKGWKTAQQFADMIDICYPDSYEFTIHDEIRPGVHYKDKVLVCIPIG